MGKQIKFELKEINTKEKMKDGVEDEAIAYKYTDALGETEIRVKGEVNARNMGLPITMLGDSILIEFGPKQTQQKLEDDLHDIGKPSGSTFPNHKKHDEPAVKTKKTKAKKK